MGAQELADARAGMRDRAAWEQGGRADALDAALHKHNGGERENGKVVKVHVLLCGAGFLDPEVQIFLELSLHPLLALSHGCAGFMAFSTIRRVFLTTVLYTLG